MLQVTPVVVAIVKAIVNEDVDRAFSTYTIEKMTLASTIGSSLLRSDDHFEGSDRYLN